MSTSNLFASSYGKLNRAEKHFAELTRKVTAFVQSEPYHKVVEPDADNPNNSVHKLKPSRKFGGEMDDIGDSACEFVQNIRAALDNAGYAIAVAIGNPDAKNSAFPFAKDIDNMACSIGRSADLPKEIQSLFCGFQPYFGGDDLLAVVNQAANTDKHRIAVPMVSTVVRERASISGNSSRFFEMPIHHVWDRTKDEMVLFTLGPGTDDQVQYDFEFSGFVAFNEIDTVKGQPILGVAHAMGCKVHGIVRAIEAESKRLGIVN